METRRQKKHARASLPPATCLHQPTLPKCSATGQISSAPGQAKFGTSQLLCGPRHCMPQGGRPLLHAMPCRDKPCVVCHMPKPASTSHVLPATAKPMSAAGHVLPATADACLVHVNSFLPQIEFRRHKPCPPIHKQNPPEAMACLPQDRPPQPQARPNRHKPKPFATGRAPSSTGVAAPQHAAHPPVCHRLGSGCQKPELVCHTIVFG